MSTRVALITGGEGDLARALAPALSAAGFEVHAPGRAELDVTAGDDVREYFRQRARVDLLINNAGRCDDAVCAKMSEAQWDSVLAVNLRGAFLCAQAASRQMVAQRSGHIVNIGSFSARYGNSGQTNYAAS